MKKILVLLSAVVLIAGCSSNISQEVRDDLAELVILNHETYINDSNYEGNYEVSIALNSRQTELMKKYFRSLGTGKFNKSEEELIREVQELLEYSSEKELVDLGIQEHDSKKLAENLLAYRDAYNDIRKKLNITDEKIDEVLSFIK